jgi:ABC-2 type transport system ATP-binding protein
MTEGAPNFGATGTDNISASPALTVSEVTKSYRRRRVLGEVSFRVAPGEAMAVVGENGSGKTTLLKICAGVLRPDGGAVGRVPKVAYCPQELGLIEYLTADEHLRYHGAGLGIDAERSRAEASPVLSWLRFPMRERAIARQLSGGTRQKLSLALSLLTDAELILLDEPYQGFDRGTYENFWEHVSEWRSRGTAVVVVTHMLGELHRVDSVLELRLDGSWTLDRSGP